MRAAAGGGLYKAAVNVGFRPTFETGHPVQTVEAHLLDFDGDLYNQVIEVAFVERLRDEVKFSGIEALVAFTEASVKVAEEKGCEDVLGFATSAVRDAQNSEEVLGTVLERTGVKIDVEDDGRVNVASADEASAQKAISIIQELTATPELNKTYLGKVQRITDFGAFVEIMPGTDGLLHVSEIANHRVKDVRDELKEGQQVLVKVINIDPTGKIRLSRKALLQDEPGAATEPAGAGKK